MSSVKHYKITIGTEDSRKKNFAYQEINLFPLDCIMYMYLEYRIYNESENTIFDTATTNQHNTQHVYLPQITWI